jgi:poly(A) polymerase
MQSSAYNLWEKVGNFRSRFLFLSDLERVFPEAEIYLVGGAVRDLLSGRETKDYDFLVRRVAASDLGAFLGRHGKVSWVGKNFGVYKFAPAGLSLEEPIDVALPRTERSFYHTGGYRDFEVESDSHLPIEEDLRRRDFTINAIAADLRQKRLIDPHGGLKDLEAGILRAVGEPSVRFSEDTSRLLRGLRFACQFPFRFEEKSWQGLKAAMPSVNAKREDGSYIVPRETIAKEFIKAMVADPVRGYDLWDESGAFEALIPELLQMKGCPQPEAFHTEGDVWTHTRLALSQLTSPAFQEEFQVSYDAEAVLAVLFHDIGKPYTIQTPERDGVDRIRFNGHDQVGGRLARSIAARLKLSTYPKESRYYVEEEQLGWLIEKHLILVHGEIDQMRASTIEKHFLNPQRPGEKLKQLIFCDGMATLPPSGIPQLLFYKTLKERIDRIRGLTAERSKVPAPLLSGTEVMEVLNLLPGPAVGKYLTLLREEQLSGRLSGREEAVAFLRTQRGNKTTPASENRRSDSIS